MRSVATSRPASRAPASRPRHPSRPSTSRSSSRISLPSRNRFRRAEPVEPAVSANPSPDSTATDDELIAQLRGSGKPALAEEEVDPPAPAISGSDLGAARLVAMNMALDGAPREKIAKQISTEFGDVPNVDDLLDDVLRRAKR